MVIIFFILGTAGLWIPLTIILFLLQIVAWVFGSTLNFADLLRRFIAGLVPLKPLTGAADCLISALLGGAALFYYGLQTSQPEWIIAAGAFPVMFGHLGDKLLRKASVTEIDSPVKNIMDLLFTLLITLGTVWIGLAAWYLKDLAAFT